jgi:hypothetical protein
LDPTLLNPIVGFLRMEHIGSPYLPESVRWWVSRKAHFGAPKKQPPLPLLSLEQLGSDASLFSRLLLASGAHWLTILTGISALVGVSQGTLWPWSLLSAEQLGSDASYSSRWLVASGAHWLTILT